MKTKEQEKTKELRKQGFTIPEIEKMVGCPRSSISYWVRGLEVSTEALKKKEERRQQKRLEYYNKKKLPKEKLESFLNQGLGLREIANTVCRSEAVVERWLKQDKLEYISTSKLREKNTKIIGDKSEAVILAELVKRGKIVLIPFGDKQRYDLVVDEKGKFIRIQVKTGRLLGDTIQFPTYTATYESYVPKSYKGEVDYFGVWCEELNKSYLIPIEKTGDTGCSLRIDTDCKFKNANYACDFEMQDVINF